MTPGPRHRLRAHAKANLFLRVLDRRPDGYHDLETLFVRLGLADTVELELTGKGSGIRLAVEGSGVGRVPGGRENLCWRAAERYCEEAGVDSGLAIRLVKRIPAGAGLGGGSADAAAVLRGLQELHGGPLPDSRIHEIAEELGSDVPFALLDCPAALGRGRGERLVPVPAPPPRPALLVLPRRPVSTAEAYGWLDEDRAAERGEGGASRAEGPAAALEREESGRGSPLPARDELADWGAIRELAVNDFEGPVFRRHPELAALRDALAEGAVGPVLLCGSGSALLAVHEDASARDAAGERLGGREAVSVVPIRVPV